MTAEDLNLGRRFKARPLNHSATLLNGRRKSIYGPYLLDLNSELMYCSQDYLGLQQSRMENWFTFSHLCSADLLSLSPLLESEVREVSFGNGLRAVNTERSSLVLPGSVAPPLPALSSCGPAFQFGWARPCPRTASYSISGLRRASKALIATRWQTGSCQPFLAGRAATCVVPFQEHWNSPPPATNWPATGSRLLPL